MPLGGTTMPKYPLAILVVSLAAAAASEPVHPHAAFSSLRGARSLQQAPAAAPATVSDVPYVSELTTILGEIGAGRPVSYKNVEAARYLAYVQAGTTVSNEPSALVPLGNGSVLVSWSNTTAAVTLAFPANSSSSTFNATDAGFAPTDVLPLLQGNFSAAYPAAAASDPFPALVSATGGRGLQATIANVSSSQEPRRVLCTGYGNGGAYAELCGIWAAVSYPAVYVRTIVFGAPVVGNANFAYAFQELVDLSYLWSTSTNLKVTNATTPATAPADEVRVLNDTATVANQSITANSFEQYVSAVIEYYNTTSGNSSVAATISTSGDQGGISGFISNIRNIASGVVNAVSNLGDILDTASSLLYSGDATEALDAPAEADAAAARADATGCPVLLCKIRPAATASCNAYNNGSNTIAPGSVTIGPVNSTGTQLALAWNATTKTATVAFQGSTSNADWITDFKAYLNEAQTSGALAQIFPDIQIHAGFLESFQSVTEDAASPALNITNRLYELSGNQQPVRVVVTGHSLGAALASIFAPWAALQWPAADVQVTSFGSPMVGNQMFAQAFKFLVGRQQRVVHALDIVPALPPLDNYFPVDYGRYIPQNSTLLVEDRPAEDFSNYTWIDHNCREYEANVYRTPFATSAANIEQTLANSSTGGASVVQDAAVASGPPASDSSSGSTSSSNATSSSGNGTRSASGSTPSDQGVAASAAALSLTTVLAVLLAALAACSL